jgi:hypothetical protein
MQSTRDCLERLRVLLVQAGEDVPASLIASALDGSEADFDRFLVSNELWGGPGSIADQAGIGAGGELHVLTKDIERALIRLGRLQIEACRTNQRTKMWVETFEHWHRSGVR